MKRAQYNATMQDNAIQCNWMQNYAVHCSLSWWRWAECRLWRTNQEDTSELIHQTEQQMKQTIDNSCKHGRLNQCLSCVLCIEISTQVMHYNAHNAKPFWKTETTSIKSAMLPNILHVLHSTEMKHSHGTLQWHLQHLLSKWGQASATRCPYQTSNWKIAD